MRWFVQLSHRSRVGFFLGITGLALVHAVWTLGQDLTPPVLPDALQQAPTVWVRGRVDGLTKLGPKSLRFALVILGVEGPGRSSLGQPLTHPIKVWVIWPMRPQQQVQLNVRPDEVWRLPLRWLNTSKLVTPDGFDALRWMQQHQLAGMAQVAATPDSQRVQRLHAGGRGIQAWRQDMRDQIFQAIPQARRAGLVAALSMGDQNAVEQDDWQIFRRTGVAHLVSISGMHVTLLAMWLAAAVNALWRRVQWRGHAWAVALPAPWLAQWVALITAAVYALFSGWGLPAQRTVWMLMAVNALRLGGLTWPAHATWLALLALNAVCDPWALSQSGFWLSQVAVALLYALEPLHDQRWWRRWLSETLGVQWKITWVLAPMSLYFFQGVSLAGLWVNLWAIPWVTLVVTPLSLLGLWVPPLWTWAGWGAGWLLSALEWAAQTPGALLEVAPIPLWSVVPGTLMALFVAMPGPWVWRAWCASMLATLFVWR
jgi:competence protein ComEC